MTEASPLIPWFTIRGWHAPFPILDRIEPFGLIVMLGVGAGVALTHWRAKRTGLSKAVMSDAILHIVLTGFLVSHAFDTFFYTSGSFTFERFTRPGLSSFGGFFGALVGAWIWKLRRRQSILVVADPIAFSFPLGFGIGRIGCFLTHDHPGTVSSFPLAVADYHVGPPPYFPRHDLGLYDAILSFALVGLFLALASKPRRPGFFVGLSPALYAPVRFFLDFLRETPERGGDVRTFGLTPAQYSALALCAMGVGVLVYVHRRPPRVIEAWP